MIPIVSARIWKTGKGYVVTIPKEYVRNGVVQMDKRYRITLQEESETLKNDAQAATGDMGPWGGLVSGSDLFSFGTSKAGII